MHSRIIQLMDTPFHKAEEHDLISTDSFDGDSLVYEVATGICDSNRESDIPWFVSKLSQDFIEYNEIEQSIVFKSGFKKSYFENIIKELTMRAKQIQDNPDVFFEPSFVYGLNRALNQYGGFYIREDGIDYTFQDFVYSFKDNKDSKFYFGNTVSYRY